MKSVPGRVSGFSDVFEDGKQGLLTVADGVRNIAVDRQLGRGEVGDAAEVLEVLGVAEQDDALDLVLDRRAQSRDGRGHDGGSLAVHGTISARGKEETGDVSEV